LLRHPIAVATSQIRAFHYNKKFTSYRIPDTLYNERYHLHYGFLNSLETQLEFQVALWCLHNVEVINHPLNGKNWLSVYYEDLVLHPERELSRISEESNIELPDLKLEKIRRPSKTDYKKDLEANTHNQLSKWQTKISGDQLNKLQRILDHFGVDIYTSLDYLPSKK
jgi:hypothetical protein